VIEIFIAIYIACSAKQACMWEGGEMPLTREMRNDYAAKFTSCTLRPQFSVAIDGAISSIEKGRARYEGVARKTNVPWQVIGVIHNLECSGDFNCHLHNGDPLRRRTVNVPAGRPVIGKPPFTWEASAIDALTYDGFNRWSDWTVAGTLYKLEGYNGFGYRKRGIPSPYLWSGSQHYERGKYVSDGSFDPKAVSKQVGAAVVLRRMSDRDLIEIPNPDDSPTVAIKPAA
jgi:lysozyme family protein